MKKLLLFLVFAFAITEMHAQFVYKIKADSLLVTNDSCTAELNLENSTKNVKGFLYNKGNGRTEFRKAVRLNDSMLVFGGDTFLIRGAAKNYSFSNGITESSGIVKWGGNVTENTTVTTYNDKMILFRNFSSPATQPTIRVDAGGAGAEAMSLLSNGLAWALDVVNSNTSGGGGIATNTQNGVGLQTTTNTGEGIWSHSFQGLPLHLSQALPTYNDVKNQIVLQRGTSGNSGFGANGIGIGIRFSACTATSQDSIGGGSIDWKWADASSSRTSQFDFKLVNNGGSLLPKFTIKGTGQLQAPVYGLGSFTGTGSYYLQSDSLGNIIEIPVNSITVPLTLQQVTSNGNTTTNNIKPYPAALPVGASTDSVVVWSATDSLLKKFAPISKLTLQQVTSYGNTTTNTIKPYPNALPIGSNNDSIVVWSATDSLLKKIGSKQTFAQTATATISASDAETTLISSGTGSLTIPASSWFIGKTFKIVLHGTYSTSSTNPATLNIKIKLGTTIIAQHSFFLGSDKDNIPYEIRAELTCRSTGSSGTVFTMGMFSTGEDGVSEIDNGTSATTVNLSTGQTIDITATLSDDAAGNAISAYMVLLEALN